MERINLKKPPNKKKRHTKPCRFFQTATCPFSTEECDFAHVLISEPLDEPCKYFLNGSNNTGVWYMKPTSREDLYFPVSPYHSIFVTPPVWPVVPETVPPLLPPVESFAPTAYESIEDLLFSDSRSSDDTLVQDDTYDMKQPQNPQYPPVFPFSVYSGNPMFPKRRSKHKSQCYKTKPCRFYNPAYNRVCPSGEACTFIHDQELCAKVYCPTYRPPRQQQSDEENKKPGIHPVTWRVIGGGVLVGNPKAQEPPPALSISVDFPRTEEDKDVFMEKVTPRARALSNPSTPTLSRANSLFSAESPGGL